MEDYTIIVSQGIWVGTSRDRAIRRNPEAFRRLKELAKGRVLYELGPGDKGGFLKFLRRVDFLMYIGIEPGVSSEFLEEKFGSDKIEFTSLDGRSFLANVPAESGIVISSAVLNPQIIPSKQYLDGLIKEIARVTPTGLSTIHFDIGLSKYTNPTFIKYGLKPKQLGKAQNLGGLEAEVYEYKKQ